MNVQINCFWSLPRSELAGTSVSFPRFLVWKRKFVFNIFHRGLWAPPLFFIGLKMFFFAGFPESIDIYTDRKVKNLLFQKTIFIYFLYITSMYRVKNVLIIVFEILISSTPLAHSFCSVLFTGLAQNVCPIWEGPFAQQFFTYIFWGS